MLSMVRTSNELAMMVPSEILEETTTHGRAKVISSFIKVKQVATQVLLRVVEDLFCCRKNITVLPKFGLVILSVGENAIFN